MNLKYIQPMIRVLNGEDAEAFSRLRREVTSDCAIGMGISLQEELSRPLEGFRAQLSAPSPNAVFGVFIDKELVATAAIARGGLFESSAHKMLMWGVFTSPPHRMKGLSKIVVTHAINHAMNCGVRRVNLTVYVPNEPAVSLYRSLGFIHCGTEHEAVFLDGHYFDGLNMTLLLSS